MFESSKKGWMLVLFTLFTLNLFSGLPVGTMVLVGDNCYTKVEDLKAGDQILVYNIPRKRFEARSYIIEQVKRKKTNKVILIETDAERVILDCEQKVYNRRIFKFIPAKEFKIGDKLFSPGIGSIEIKNVSLLTLERAIETYDISIKDGNLFLICGENGTNILVHNIALEFTLIVSASDVILKGLGALATGVGLFALSHFSSKRKRQRAVKRKNSSDIENVIRNSKKEQKNGGTATVYVKSGGKKEKDKDFKKLNVVRERVEDTSKGKIRFGRTANGETIVDRDFSSERSGNKKTLEIQRSKYDKVKIRYDE